MNRITQKEIDLLCKLAKCVAPDEWYGPWANSIHNTNKYKCLICNDIIDATETHLIIGDHGHNHIINDKKHLLAFL